MKDFLICLFLTCSTGFSGSVLASSFFEGMKDDSLSDSAPVATSSSKPYPEPALRSLSKKSFTGKFFDESDNDDDDDKDEANEGKRDPDCGKVESSKYGKDDRLVERLSEYIPIDSKRGKSKSFFYYPNGLADSPKEDDDTDFDRSHFTSKSVNWNYLFTGEEKKKRSDEERPSLYGRVSLFFKKKSEEMANRKARNMLEKIRAEMMEEVREVKESKENVRFPIARFLLDKYQAREARLAQQAAQKAEEKAQSDLKKQLNEQKDRLKAEHREAIGKLQKPAFLMKIKSEQINNVLEDEYDIAENEKGIIQKGSFEKSPLFAANRKRIESLLKGQRQLSSSAESEDIIRWLLHACKNSDFFLQWKREEDLEDLISVFFEQSIDYYIKRLHKLHAEINLNFSFLECVYDQLISGKFDESSFNQDFQQAIDRYEAETPKFMVLCLNAVHISEVLNSIIIIRNNC